MIKKLKEHKKIFFILICFIMFIFFILSPVNFDTRIYLEAAQRADTLDFFPANIVQAWEHKFVLNRLLFYLLYKLASIFTSPNNIILFEIIIKTIYGLLSYVIIKYFTKNTADFFKKYNITETTVFFILYFVTMMSGIYFSLQTEMTALLLLLLSIAFVLKSSYLAKLLSAFIISSLFWFKGVTLLYSVVVLIVMLLAKQRKSDIIFTICWSVIFLILELLVLLKFAPIEAINMYLSTKYLTDSIFLFSPAKFILESLVLYKFLTIGIIAFVINLVYHIKYKNIKLLSLELFSWAILFAGVCLQKMLYHYQIGLMIPAILLSIFVFIYCQSKSKLNKNLATSLSICFLAILFTNTALNFSYTIEIYKETLKNSKNLEILEKEIPDLKDNKILYIGNGMANYYLKTPSYTNYATTIFLANYNSVYLNSDFVQKLKEDIKKYDGKYIIIDESEFLTKFRVSDDIIEFIEENYHYKQSTGISIYEMKCDEYSIIYERNI